MAEICYLEKRHDVIFFCRGWFDLDKISQTGAECYDCGDMAEIETRSRIPIWRSFGRWHVIPEPRITLQGGATWWIHCHYSRATLQSAVTWRNQCHDRATLQGVIIPSAILKIVFRHILFYLLFYLLQFGLWRAAAFVWSPIHLLQVIQLFALSTRKYGGFLAYELTAKIESFLRKAVQWGFSSHYKCLTDLLREADLHLFRKIWHQTVGMIASISYFLPQKFCPWSLETLTVYLPYRLTPVPSVIITCTNILLFLGICFFSAYWMHVRWHCIFSYFLVLIYLLMLCLQLAEGVWSSFIKRITYLLTYLPLLI